MIPIPAPVAIAWFICMALAAIGIFAVVFGMRKPHEDHDDVNNVVDDIVLHDMQQNDPAGRVGD